MELPECKSNDYTPEFVYIINESDVKYINGEVVVKRKYGKFTRPVYKIPAKMPNCTRTNYFKQRRGFL